MDRLEPEGGHRSEVLTHSPRLEMMAKAQLLVLEAAFEVRGLESAAPVSAVKLDMEPA